MTIWDIVDAIEALANETVQHKESCCSRCAVESNKQDSGRYACTRPRNGHAVMLLCDGKCNCDRQERLNAILRYIKEED